MHHQALTPFWGNRWQQRGFRHLQGQMGPAVGGQEPQLAQREGVSAECRGKEEAEPRTLQASSASTGPWCYGLKSPQPGSQPLPS